MAKKFTNIVRGQNRLEIRNEAEATQIHLMGSVGKSWWDDSGITEKETRDALKSSPRGKKIHVHINSEGGSVQEGLGIYNAFKERAADITCFVDGYALSIASIFPLAAGKVVSPKSAIWMMHKAWSWAQGNADDMSKQATMLAEHDEMLAEIYADETGRPIQEMRDAMAAETWIRGSAAVEFGLADETDDENDQQAAAYRPLAQNYLSRCKNVSAEILNLFTGQPPETQARPATPAISGATTKDNTMNKAKIVALLKKQGIEAKDDWTDEQFEEALNKLTVKAEAPATTAQPDNSGLMTELTAIRAQLDEEKKTRITARVDAIVSETRITKDEREDAISRAVKDESYLAVLAKRPQLSPDGQPIGGASLIISNENPLEKIKAEHKTPLARVRAMREDWKALLDDAFARDTRRGMQPLNSNTYSGTLVTSFLVDGAITNLQNVWAALSAFSLDKSADPFKPLAAAVVRQVTVGGATQTDATNFESGNSTVAPISVTMHQYTQSFQVSNSDLQNGLRMEHLVTINMANFANKLLEVATAPITTGNFGAAVVTRAAANFDFGDLATLQASLKLSPIKNLILDGSYIARIANTPAFFQAAGVVGGGTGAWKAFGWDLIAPLSDWTGAGANIQGFACHPQAIQGIIGLPVAPVNAPAGIWNVGSFFVPGPDVTVAMYSWFNPATRTMWTSYDLMAGFNAADTTAGFIVSSQ